MLVQEKPSGVGRKFRRFLLLCGLGVLGIPGIASAATVQYSLADLLPGGSQANGFTIGDKQYSNFKFSSPTGPRPLTPQDVNVRVTSSDANSAVPGDDRYQLQYTFGLDAMPGERHDLVLEYDVAVLNPSMFIDHLGLRFNGAIPSQGVGNAAASVVERAFYLSGPGGQVIGDAIQMDVYNDGPGRGLADDNSDFITINPARYMRFEKDITVSSQNNGGYAVISVVDNIVDQNVPEPSVIGLAVFAGGGLLLRRRR
jgi:hypothetical protein